MYKIEAKDNDNEVKNLEYVEPEIWKDIEGFGGWYEVSNKGRIRSYKYDGGKTDRRDVPIILNPNQNHRYERLTLHNNGDRGCYNVHRLVAEAFIPNPENLPQINHIDGNPFNNNVNNLEWCDASHNANHAYDLGLREAQTGTKNGNAQVTEDQVLEIRAAYNLGCFTQVEIAKAYGVSKHVIHFIVNRKSWTHI